MEVRAPSWSLAGERCACCDGEGALFFSACPACGRTLLMCDEVGAAFTAGRGESPRTFVGTASDESSQCPGCGRASLASFRAATGEEIQALGYGPGEYV